MRKLFPVIFIFFTLSLFSLKFIYLLPLLFIPLFFGKRKDFLIFFTIFILVGIVRSGFLSFPSFENPETNTLVGKVISFEKENSFEIKTDYGKIVVFKNRYYNIKPFDEIEIKGEFLNDFGGNPGEESFILYSISKNSILKFYAREVKVIKRDKSKISMIRDKLYKNFDLLKDCSFLRGIFMGGGSVNRKIKDKFKYAGVMHLLAVSGLHLSILSLFLSLIFPPIIVVIFLFLYLFLILFPISAVRAFVMISTYLIGKSLYKDVDTLNSLLFGAMIILFINPLSLISPSFLLTFLSTLSIISIISSVRGKIEKMLLISPVSLFGIFPVLIYYFPIFSPISFISNIIVTPLFTILLPLTFIISFLSLIYKNFILLLRFPAKFFLSLVNLFSNTPISYIGIKKPHFLFLVLYFALFLFLIVKRNFKIRIKWEKAIIGLLIIFIIISFIYPYYAERGIFKIVFFDVGEGDSIFIKTPLSRTILVDGGGSSSERKISPGERVLDSLKRMGVNRIDMMVFTHEDIDHIEGLFHVIKKEKVKFLLGPDIKLSKIGKNLISLGKEKGVKFIPIKEGDIVSIGKDIKIYVLNPVKGGKDYGRAYDNNNSIFLVVKYRDFSVVLSGDVEKERLKEISNEFPDILMNTTIYKVSHHGSKFSLSRDFFNAISPKISVISVGPNRFGHPSPLIINSLEEIGSKVYRTDRDGAVEIKTNGKSITIKTYNFQYMIDKFIKPIGLKSKI